MKLGTRQAGAESSTTLAARSDEQVSDAALRVAGLLLHASKGPREADQLYIAHYL